MGAGSQKVDYVLVLAQVTHDLQFRHEGLLLIGVSRGCKEGPQVPQMGRKQDTEGHIDRQQGSRQGYPERRNNQESKEGGEMRTHRWVLGGGGEREREERWPVTELVSSGKESSCGQVMAQAGLCVPQPLCTPA